MSSTPQRFGIVWLATGLGLGMVMPAPGTWGALLGVFLSFALQQLPTWEWQLGATILLPLLSIPLCTRAGQLMGDRKDPQSVIFDELATVPIIFLFTPMTSFWRVLAGFLLHRAFDITKPWPCNDLERLPAGLGVTADDVMAGIYAAGVMWLLVRYAAL